MVSTGDQAGDMVPESTRVTLAEIHPSSHSARWIRGAKHLTFNSNLRCKGIGLLALDRIRERLEAAGWSEKCLPEGLDLPADLEVLWLWIDLHAKIVSGIFSRIDGLGRDCFSSLARRSSPKLGVLARFVGLVNRYSPRFFFFVVS